MTDFPGELQEPNPRDLLRQYIWKEIECGKQYIIYGCTVYSFILNEWIKEKTGKYTYLIPHKELEKEVIDNLKKDFPQYSFCTLEEAKKSDIDVVWDSIEADFPDICKEFRKSKVINVYDCSDRIEAYYNPQIEKLKNIHQGQRCFIVATGPSLRMDDLDTLKENNEICISLNSIWEAFTMTEWRPDYYVVEDHQAMEGRYGEGTKNIEARYVFVGDTNGDFWDKDHASNMLRYHACYEYSEKKLPKFSENFAQKCYAAGTVTYSCMQLAAYMGFKNIYLLGVDFSYYGLPRNVKYTHFFQYRENDIQSVAYTEQVLLAYQSAKLYADSHDMKICNATRGGKLEVFERVDFDSLFQ